MLSEFLQINPRISVLPVIHGSGDCAVEVRRTMLTHKFDCLAVPLPRSFQQDVETAIDYLPGITIVAQEKSRGFEVSNWTPESEQADAPDTSRELTYVPVDPCQPVIAALRIAVQEHMPRAFIDAESETFSNHGAVLPDPYALKKVAADKFAAAVLPTIGPIPMDRIRTMAARLRELQTKYERILLVCSIVEWPWIRDAFHAEGELPIVEDEVEETDIFGISPEGLLFTLGELPFITGLYEKARYELDDDENLSIEGIKELALTSRDRYKAEFKTRARRISPQMLSVYFRYVRNLSLIERRMTPDLYSLVVAAQQTAGDQYATVLAETARTYPFDEPTPFDEVRMGIDRGQLPDGDFAKFTSRLPGHPIVWRSCELKPLPDKKAQQELQREWDPMGQCSWPPEDVAIERFRTRIKDIALDLIGTDLARTEKFSTSLKDGLDMRETLRNWHTGNLYVKIFPPARGRIDCVIMLFDSPADPRDYPWRITWHAETHDESTLSLFATDFTEEMVGPGIALASYGGCMFLFPPRPIPDIWRDPRFHFCDTLEERLIAAGTYHAEEKHVALLSHLPPGPGWKRLAKNHGKTLVHVPLGRFGAETIQQLRMFHVLNGKQIRSFAAHFIRKA